MQGRAEPTSHPQPPQAYLATAVDAFVVVALAVVVARPVGDQLSLLPLQVLLGVARTPGGVGRSRAAPSRRGLATQTRRGRTRPHQDHDDLRASRSRGAGRGRGRRPAARPFAPYAGHRGYTSRRCRPQRQPHPARRPPARTRTTSARATAQRRPTTTAAGRPPPRQGRESENHLGDRPP